MNGERYKSKVSRIIPSDDDSLSSPCIRNCCLDTNDICVGCFRSLQEILDWGNASDELKRTILQNTQLRKQQRRNKEL